MTMERKIGEIFEYNGEWYQCVETDPAITEYGIMYCCDGCSMPESDCCDFKCSDYERSDKKQVIFKKLGKVGEPYPLYDHIVQRYAGVKFPVAMTEKRFINCNEINNTIDIEIKQNTGDMETNEKTISIPEGWEFGRIDDSGNIVLREKKEELPKAWEDCLREIDKVEVLNCTADIMKIDINGCKEIDYHNRSMLPRGMGNPMLALCQLLVCRNAWWKQLGWKPDWNDRKSLKHCIHSDGFSTTDITRHSTFPRILAFPTEDTAIDFRNTFKDLIEEAKELL